VNNGRNVEEAAAVWLAFWKRMGAYYPDFDQSYEEISLADQTAGLLNYNEDDIEMADIIMHSLVTNQVYMLLNDGGYDNATSSIFSGNETPKEAFDRIKNSVQAQVDEFNNY
jgi:hypothetical protein